MPAAKRGRKATVKRCQDARPLPSTSEEVIAEVHVKAAEKSPSQPPEEDFPDLPITKKARLQRTTTSYSDEEKEEILDFLKANPSIYEKRRADYVCINQKYQFNVFFISWIHILPLVLSLERMRGGNP